MVTTNDLDTISDCNPEQNIGWCVAPIPPNVAVYQDNLTWRNHTAVTTANTNDDDVYLDQVGERLDGYLLGRPSILGEGIKQYYFEDEIYKERSQILAYDRLSVDDVIGRTTNNESYLANSVIGQTILQSGKYDEIGIRVTNLVERLSKFMAGDYIIIRGPSPHGFIITHSGVADECQGAIFTNQPITSTNVPFVADLAGTQDGDIRPFYCTRIPQDYNDVDINGNIQSFFRFRYWHFIRVPDLWLIRFSRLYPIPCSEFSPFREDCD